MPRRALQTRQIRLGWRLKSLICCSSQKPISRSRLVISGGASRRLMRTAAPATTRLSGQIEGSQWPSCAWHGSGRFTCAQIIVIETGFQEGFFKFCFEGAFHRWRLPERRAEDSPALPPKWVSDAVLSALGRIRVWRRTLASVLDYGIFASHVPRIDP